MESTTSMLERVKKAAVLNGVATPEEIEAIANDRSICRLTLEDLEQLKAYLQNYLEELDNGYFYKVGGSD